MEKFIAALILCLSLTGCFYPKDKLDAMADTPGSSLDLVIPLDVAVAASNPQRFAVRGKYIQIDPGSTGQANLRINSVSDAARLAYPGQQFSPGDFTDLYFDYPAQPGKFLHVLYGDSPDILSAGVKSISDPTINATVFQAQVAGAGLVNIVPAANNINGIKILACVLSAEIRNSAAGGAAVRISLSTGNIWLGGTYLYTAVAGFFGFDSFNCGQFYIPPGQSLDYFTENFGGGVSLKESIFLNYQIL